MGAFIAFIWLQGVANNAFRLINGLFDVAALSSSVRTSMAETPLRAVRIPDEVWNAARNKSEREGTTVTAVILAALEKYVKRP